MNLQTKDQAVLFRLLSSTNIKKEEDILPHILSLIQFFSRHDEALSIVDTNRRFGQAIKKHSGRPFSDFVQTLLDRGAVGIRRHARKVWLFDAVLVERLIEEEGLELELEKEQRRNDIIDLWVRNAMEADAV